MIKKFLFSVEWGAIDYLVVDTPPGTSDEHISVAELLAGHQRARALMVTTPQLVALADVEREVTFCATVGMPLIGLVENMSGYACPSCAHCTRIFAAGGAAQLCERRSLTFLGHLPIYPPLLRLFDGRSSAAPSIAQAYAAQAACLHERLLEIVTQHIEPPPA